jgi:response regulator RpfG family c-di-GMP phosphodiesterase
MMHDALALPPVTAEGAATAKAAPEWTLLCVDDEPNIVSALRRLFRTAGYRMLTAHSGAQALEVLASEPVDLVISDMRMPGMDGAHLLEEVRARWPRIMRLLLTGYADVQSTVAAINRGEVYRYITKPWNDQEILLTVREALEREALQREKTRLEALTQQQNDALKVLNATLEEKVALRTQELTQSHERLKKSYLTSIKTFSALIELRGGQLAGHARRVADFARRTAKAMNVPDAGQQEIFVAGLLHDIGHIGLPDTLLSCPIPRMSDDDLSLYRKHPVLGEQALMALDDMQGVATLIRSHHERHDGEGFPDRLRGEAIAVGARILAVVDAYDDLLTGHLGARGLTTAEACTIISRGRGTRFDPETVDIFLQLCVKGAPTATMPPRRTATGDLVTGMVLARDLVSAEGVVLLASGQRLTDDLIRRIKVYEKREGIQLVLWTEPPASR